MSSLFAQWHYSLKNFHVWNLPYVLDLDVYSCSKSLGKQLLGIYLNLLCMWDMSSLIRRCENFGLSLSLCSELVKASEHQTKAFENYHFKRSGLFAKKLVWFSYPLLKSETLWEQDGGVLLRLCNHINSYSKTFTNFSMRKHGQFCSKAEICKNDPQTAKFKLL